LTATPQVLKNLWNLRHQPARETTSCEQATPVTACGEHDNMGGRMARVFITGSTDGLGRAAARALIDEGHEVVLHARNNDRVAALADLEPASAGLVIGDLSSATETRRVAVQVNAIGRMDAVIHNAGVYLTNGRSPTPEGHPTTLAVNTLAPYILTALIERPRRLIYLSSGMHRSGVASLRDLDWNERRWNASQSYSDTKLHVTTLAFAVARLWPDVLSNAVDPGWVATKMGGPGAPDDLEEGHRTQTWLAVSDDPAATVSGHYWHHRRREVAAKDASDRRFQDGLLTTLADTAGVSL
jgi:NAD(P)-dependent dehydrogenase (short-subunit alcohol dehydrogenase family)